MGNAQGAEDGLHRALGRFSATSVVVGAIIGVGIFFTPSRIATVAGSAELAMWTWVIGGAIALAGALTFAELGGMYPETGGQYGIVRDAYGPGVGFVYVLCNATAVQAGAIGIIGLIFVQNLQTAVSGSVAGGWTDVSLAAGAILITAGANAWGVRLGATIQNATVVAKLVALAAIVAVAVSVEPAPAERATGGAPPTTLFAALVPCLFTFGGWQQALWMGGEVKDPKRNLPFAIVVGVVIVVTTYVAVNWAYLQLLGHAGVAESDALAADAVGSAYPAGGRRAIAVAVAISAYGVLNAQLLTGPRLVFALARDGRFFPSFGQAHAQRGTPTAAIGLMTATALVLLLAAGEEGIDRLLTGVVLVDTVFFALTGAASFALLRRKPRNERPIRMPGFPLVPAMFVLAEIGVIVGAWLDPKVRGAAVIGVAWIVGAAGLYLWRFRDRQGNTLPR